MVTMSTMVITPINTMQINIYTLVMIMKRINLIFLFTTSIILSGCNLSPGMHLSPESSWVGPEHVLIGNYPKKKIIIEDIDYRLISDLGVSGKEPYKIGVGDKLSVVVWGLPDIFPLISMSSDQTLRVVNTDGTVFFPYAGAVKAVGLTQVELRKELTKQLEKNFNEPQLDVSIARFDSQMVYLLGEISSPQKISITETPLSLDFFTQSIPFFI